MPAMKQPEPMMSVRDVKCENGKHFFLLIGDSEIKYLSTWPGQATAIGQPLPIMCQCMAEALMRIKAMGMEAPS